MKDTYYEKFGLSDEDIKEAFHDFWTFFAENVDQKMIEDNLDYEDAAEEVFHEMEEYCLASKNEDNVTYFYLYILHSPYFKNNYKNGEFFIDLDNELFGEG